MSFKLLAYFEHDFKFTQLPYQVGQRHPHCTAEKEVAGGVAVGRGALPRAL